MEETGIDVEWTRCGLLMVDFELDPLIESWAERHECRVQPLDGIQTESLEPALREGFRFFDPAA